MHRPLSPRHWRHRAFRLVTGVLLVATLAGCTSAPAPAPVATSAPAPAPTLAARPTTAPAAPTAVPAAPTAVPAAAPTTAPTAAAKPSLQAGPATKIAVSYPDGGAHLPLFIAREKGIFTKYGLEVDLQGLGGGPVATAALLGGDIQIADITGSEIVAADAKGADVLVLATLTPIYPYVFMVSKDITTKDNLKGKTIAVRAVGDATDIATRVMLKMEGLDAETDVSIQAVNQENARMASLQTGQICCTVAQVSDRLVLEQLGFHTLFDLTTQGLPNAQGVIATKRDYAQANPQVVQNFINALIEGIAVMKADRAGALPVLKAQLKLDDDTVVAATYDFFAKEVVPSVPLPAPKQFADGIAILAEKDTQIAGFDVSKYIDPSYVNKAVALGLDKAP